MIDTYKTIIYEWYDFSLTTLWTLVWDDGQTWPLQALAHWRGLSLFSAHMLLGGALFLSDCPME